MTPTTKSEISANSIIKNNSRNMKEKEGDTKTNYTKDSKDGNKKQVKHITCFLLYNFLKIIFIAILISLSLFYMYLVSYYGFLSIITLIATLMIALIFEIYVEVFVEDWIFQGEGLIAWFLIALVINLLAIFIDFYSLFNLILSRIY